MRISPVYNLTLLQIIREKKNVDVEELRTEMSSCDAVFNNDLNILQSMGYIHINEGKVSYIER